MYEDVMIALACVMIYLQLRSNDAEIFATRVFYSFMSLFVGVLLAGTAVIVAGPYGASLVTAATVGLLLMVAIVIIETVMLMLYLFFFGLMPPKYRKWLEFWWT